MHMPLDHFLIVSAEDMIIKPENAADKIHASSQTEPLLSFGWRNARRD